MKSLITFFFQILLCLRKIIFNHIQRGKITTNYKIKLILVQILSYFDSVFDACGVTEETEKREIPFEKIIELDEIGHVNNNVAMLGIENFGKLINICGNVKEDEKKLLEESKPTEESLRGNINTQRLQLINGQLVFEEEAIPSLSHCQSVNGDMNSCSTSVASFCSSEKTANIQEVSFPPPPPPPPPPLPPSLPLTSSPYFIQKLPPPPPFPVLPESDKKEGTAFDGTLTIKRKVQTKYKLPTLNWVTLKANQVQGTIFNELDDNKLFSVIDFNKFEEKFKLGGSNRVVSDIVVSESLSTVSSKRFKKQENISLLEHTRLRNIAIARRKIELSVDKITEAINSLELNKVPLDCIDLLMKMVPTETERKAYQNYIADNKDMSCLTEEDKFIFELTKVERLSNKLLIMSYLGTFQDNVNLLIPQLHFIASASDSVKNSKKLMKVLEVVLAFGNYLNSGKRGPAYGFKLQSLDTLLDTKSSDKQMCLLHYIVETIKEKFPELMNFDSELTCIDKASLVSLENIMSDVGELEKGMVIVRNENDCIRDRVLEDFIENSEKELKKLRLDSKMAKESFQKCVEYFGENSRTSETNNFFSLIFRFIKAFKIAEQENEQRKRLEAAVRETLKNNSQETTSYKKIKKNHQVYTEPNCISAQWREIHCMIIERGSRVRCSPYSSNSNTIY